MPAAQTQTEVTLRVALSGPLAGTARSDVACKFMPRKLRLSLDKGEPVLDGELDEGYNLTGSFWQFEDAPGGGRVLSVVMEKLMTAGSWEYLLETDVAAVSAEVTDKVYLDIAIDGAPEGRLTIGLFGKARTSYVGLRGLRLNPLARVEADARRAGGAAHGGQLRGAVHRREGRGRVGQVAALQGIAVPPYHPGLHGAGWRLHARRRHRRREHLRRALRRRELRAEALGASQQAQKRCSC